MLSPNALNAYRGRSVLVTGGLGFIGSNLAHRLVEIGDVEVTLIDSMEKEQGGNLFNVDDIKDRVSSLECFIRLERSRLKKLRT